PSRTTSSAERRRCRSRGGAVGMAPHRLVLRQWLTGVLCMVVAFLVAGAPVAQEYTIGPGDILKITVWGHDDLSRDYPVAQDGRVPFPLIGSVQAGGPTPPDVDRGF